MNTLPKTDYTIEWPGAEPIKATRTEANDTLRACAFLRKQEEVTITKNGTKTTQRDIARPWGINERQAEIATEILAHRMKASLEDLLPDAITVSVLSPETGCFDGGTMLEVGDGWTIGCTIDHTSKRARYQDRWDCYDPEGDAIQIAVSDRDAATALLGAIARQHAADHFNSVNHN